jgi:predicted nucleic-acid-binding protein
MSLIDANVVLRYLLEDHAELTPRATEILEQQQVTLPIEAACEVVYVLQKVYTVERDIISARLTELIMDGLVRMDKPVVFLRALACYRQHGLDFVDCLLLGYHLEEQQPVITFDRKLAKLIQQSARFAERRGAGPGAPGLDCADAGQCGGLGGG